MVGVLYKWSNEKNLYKINEGVLQILENVGVKIEHKKIRALLHQAGAKVDNRKQIVRFPQKVVEKTIAMTRGSGAKRIQGGKLQQGIGGVAFFYYDWKTKQRRRATKEDLVNMIRLGDCLDEILSVSPPLTNSQAHPKIEPIESCVICIQNTRPERLGGRVEVVEPAHIKYLAEIGGVMTGKDYDTRFIADCNFFNSPLLLGWRSGECILEKTKYGMECVIGSQPLSGGTSPVTPAGNIVIAAAEILAGWTIAKTLNPEISVGAIGCTGSIDMRTGRGCFSSPEAIIQDIGLYHLFDKVYGSRIFLVPSYHDAKIPGLQSVFHHLLKRMAFATAGIDLGYSAGGLEAGRTFSPVQMMLDVEINECLHQIEKGFDVNEESLALDIIQKVGAGTGKSYLDTDHTLAYFRDVQWFPKLFDRTSFENGMKEAEKEEHILEKADVRWRETLAKWSPTEVDKDKLKDVQKIVDKARKELIA